MSGQRFAVVSRVCLLALYAVISIHYFPNWEFTGDDGRALSTALRLLHDPFGSTNTNSLGIYYSPVIYHVYSIFYYFHPSLVSVQLGILAGILLGHYFLMLIGQELGRPALGYFASLFLFFSPSLFNDFNQKFWEPALLPAFSSFMLWSLLRYLNSGRFKFILASFFGLMFCLACHAGAMLFLPVLLVGIALKQPSNEVGFNFKNIFTLILITIVGAAGIIYWAIEAYPLAFVVVALLALISVVFLQKVKNVSHFIFYFLFVCLPVAIFGWSLFYSNAFQQAPEAIVDIISPFGAYIPLRIGVTDFFESNLLRYFPEAMLVVVFIVMSLFHFQRQILREKILVIWVVFPLFMAILTGALMRSFPHQWTLILFPGLWIAILLPVFRLLDLLKESPKIRRTLMVVLIGMVVLNASYSFRYAAQIRRSGGIRWHHASLSTKEAVIRKILKTSAEPAIFLALSQAKPLWWYDVGGWYFLVQNMKASDSSAEHANNDGRVFYIFQEDGIASDPRVRQKLAQIPMVKIEKTASVTVFQCKRRISGLGIKLY